MNQAISVYFCQYPFQSTNPCLCRCFEWLFCVQTVVVCCVEINWAFCQYFLPRYFARYQPLPVHMFGMVCILNLNTNTFCRHEPSLLPVFFPRSIPRYQPFPVQVFWIVPMSIIYTNTFSLLCRHEPSLLPVSCQDSFRGTTPSLCRCF